jgi:hypothetical protein
VLVAVSRLTDEFDIKHSDAIFQSRGKFLRFVTLVVPWADLTANSGIREIIFVQIEVHDSPFLNNELFE